MVSVKNIVMLRSRPTSIFLILQSLKEPPKVINSYWGTKQWEK